MRFLAISAIIAAQIILAPPILAQGWRTNDDYPPEALKDGAQGTAEFELTYGADGKTQSCRITKSAGHPALDEGTCKILMKRARFNPGKDANGNPLPGRYTNRMNWRIPQ